MKREETSRVRYFSAEGCMLNKKREREGGGERKPRGRGEVSRGFETRYNGGNNKLK